MFVVLISFPPIKKEKDTDFKQWFASTNKEFVNFKGFISRRLLKHIGDGNYAAIVEFEDQESFKAMHSSPEHEKAGERVRPLFDGSPTPSFYEVVIN